MLSAKAEFTSLINQARHSTAIYDYLVGHVAGPISFDDILRFQYIYSVSAFDKLMHDIIRIGMIDCYTGNRPPTSKYQAEQISISIHTSLVAATVPPAISLLEAELVRKFSHLSFQDPAKVADGLSYIWTEEHKWVKINAEMGLPPGNSRIRLKLIVDRRNSIVHEADINPVTGQKASISRAEAIDVIDFIENCGVAIVNLVL